MAFGVLLDPGTEIAGQFSILRPLGEGGMGAVYVALQKSTGKERALKIMHREIVADPGLKKRFEQEAKVGAHIRSEHVVDVLAAGVDEATGLPYLVMELLEGEDLRHRLVRGPIPSDEVFTIFEQLCHAMGAAHAGGVVHRDLKPENVFLARTRRAGGGAFTVKVLDFGIAKLALEAGTRSTKGALGSPMWMAPEQTTPGPVSAPADVWALGLLAFELLTGKSFWRAPNDSDGTTAQLLREIVLDPIPAASQRALERGVASLLPPGFDAWFARCVAREPGQRYANAALAWAAMRTSGKSSSIAAELAATHIASAVDAGAEPPIVRTPLSSDTGDATSFRAPPGGGAPVQASANVSPFVPSLPRAPDLIVPAPYDPSSQSRVSPETPIASVRERSVAPPASPRGRWVLPVAASAVALAIGLGGGVFIALRRPPVQLPMPVATMTAPSATTPTPTEPTPTAPAAQTVASSETAAPSASPAVTAPPRLAAKASATPSSTVSSTPPSPPSPPAPSAPKRTIAGGFADPFSINGHPTQWKVQDRHVRLLTRIASNESNVADAVVKKAIEWDAWRYLLCYERILGGMKDLPDITVVVDYEILDQLPRHGKLRSSTSSSDVFNKCVVSTLIGQTINAAGPDGAGHAAHAFRFIPD